MSLKNHQKSVFLFSNTLKQQLLYNIKIYFPILLYKFASSLLLHSSRTMVIFCKSCMAFKIASFTIQYSERLAGIANETLLKLSAILIALLISLLDIGFLDSDNSQPRINVTSYMKRNDWPWFHRQWTILYLFF